MFTKRSPAAGFWFIETGLPFASVMLNDTLFSKKCSVLVFALAGAAATATLARQTARPSTPRVVKPFIDPPLAPWLGGAVGRPSVAGISGRTRLRGAFERRE